MMGKNCKHSGVGRIALVREFYANLGDRKNLTCYVRGKWVPFGERTLSQLFEIKEERDCSEYEELKKNLNLDEIEKQAHKRERRMAEHTDNSHAYLYRGDLTEVNKV